MTAYSLVIPARFLTLNLFVQVHLILPKEKNKQNEITITPHTLPKLSTDKDYVSSIRPLAQHGLLTPVTAFSTFRFFKTLFQRTIDIVHMVKSDLLSLFRLWLA